MLWYCISAGKIVACTLPKAVVCTNCDCKLSERLVRFCLNFECPPSVGCFSANRLKQRKLKVTKISLFDGLTVDLKVPLMRLLC